MHLKSLTMKGFKSFASSTTLKLEPGICAVVGPNGSGKSNVVDALAWVMGEQGAKTLRGGKMEDVIFAGAGDRKALGRAEVTLTIDNSDGALPIEYTEVSVTRRMFRDGASEYEINGAKARLMDIQELLSDSGIGREMHVIVGQGRLSQILESRPEERRSYIEEAAGVLKHRRRKEKAQRKLVSMQGNLDRLHDLTDELAKQLKPLARQAEAAQKAEQVQATIRSNRLLLTADKVRRLSDELNDADEQARVLEHDISELKADLEEHTTELAVTEEELRTALEEAEAAKSLWFRLSTVAEKNSATLRIAADRAADQGSESQWRSPSGQSPEELLQRAEQAEEEQATLDEEVEVASERLEHVREEVAERDEAAREAEREHMAQVRAIADRREGIVRLLAQQEAVEQRRIAAQQEVQRLEAEVAEQRETMASTSGSEATAAAEALAEVEAQGSGLDEAAERAAAESAGAEQRVTDLRSTERDLEREIASLEASVEAWRDRLRPTDGAAVVVRAAEAQGQAVPRTLTGLLGVRDGWESALAAVLPTGLVTGSGTGGSADSSTSSANGDNTTAQDALVAALVEAGEGRAVLLEATGSGKKGDSWRLDVADSLAASGTSGTSGTSNGPDWLLDHLDVAEDIVPAVTALLVDVVAVPSVARGREVVAADPRLRAVTPDGVLVGAGWVAAGSGGTTPVELGARIERAEEDIVHRRSELSDLQATLGGAGQAAEELRTAAAGATAAVREHRTRLTAARQRLEAAERTAAQAGRQLEKAVAQRDAAEQRREALDTEADEVAERLDRIGVDASDPDGASGTSGQDEPSTQERDATAQALTQARAMEMEARLSLRTAEERAGNHRGRADGLRRQARQDAAARDQFEKAAVKRRAARERAEVVAAQARRVELRIRDALDRAEATRSRTDEAHRQWQSALNERKDKVNTLTLRLNHLTDTSHSAEIARSQAQLRIEQALEQAMDQLGMSAAQLLAEAPGEDFDRDEAAKDLKAAEKSLRSLGKVNPLALEEYTALEERYRFLATQLDDVERARTDLEGVIRDVDDTILTLFTEAWNDVEAEFPKVFDTLFPGGAGRLVLTEPSDMLTTGIEVEARPPGKKVKRLSLLSGGEKSLTALALLVAIFRARPSPFYVMDEVEAALDDVNLRRLIALFEELREDSQLIVITHQKPTMDVANVLYGVTMRGDGVTRVISQRMHPVSAVSAPST
ncbi:MAG: chromosome segregation protein SMC [Corynebacterium sp.]|uniref:chromosome segregation protein SMC n=1 Tax=Corynebacterium sp. TaxID=1720 RepID=UPI0026497F23|nr:chromosome segregation protein SMC [Corynebacterium sp.]MDN6281850.1 chromosome segregation protein SMC [Corynebacterium sp.]MDN6305952.1 chromosome segregation protein SMC [Corynebacterium sp.]MDN6367713.1 chromosome segregation protein SMC [Corynebacterium sp.]MDN6375282.1 chromosome segregation protein SMC [Corynebacterium sp.]MDN6396673.1 chromosome segregation protein SMC [Corynebacterium sp.]